MVGEETTAKRQSPRVPEATRLCARPPAHLSLFSCDPLLLLLLSGGALAGGSGGRLCRFKLSPLLLKTRLSASASQAWGQTGL